MNEFVAEIIKGICWAIPVGIGIYIGMYFGAKVLREKIMQRPPRRRRPKSNR